MCNLLEVPDNSFDLVIACDVLEHVADDSEAMSEIYRVLTDNGYVILTVPQEDNLSNKLEDPTITEPDERKRIFGQNDHLRIYGDDFNFFLESFGFSVTIVDENTFSTTMVRKNVLFPPELSTHPLATNYRKVFFGRK